MLHEFIKRSWQPYLAGLASFSMAFAILLITSGGTGVEGVLMLTLSILIIAAPVTLVVAMPIAFWAWRILQQRAYVMSKIQAIGIAFGVGALLHTVLLMLLGGWMALPRILPFTVLCGGGYGATFAFFFTQGGGLRLINDNKEP